MCSTLTISELNGLFGITCKRGMKTLTVRVLVYRNRNVYSPLYLISILGFTTVIEGDLNEGPDQGVGQSWGKREEPGNSEEIQNRA